MKEDPDGVQETEERPSGEGPLTGYESVDLYAPAYAALLSLGVQPDAADRMDISTAAYLLGRTGGDSADETLTDAEGNPAPATSSHGIRKPKWWRGDRQAFQDMQQASRDIASFRDGGGPG